MEFDCYMDGKELYGNGGMHELQGDRLQLPDMQYLIDEIIFYDYRVFSFRWISYCCQLMQNMMNCSVLKCMQCLTQCVFFRGYNKKEWAQSNSTFEASKFNPPT